LSIGAYMDNRNKSQRIDLMIRDMLSRCRFAVMPFKYLCYHLCI